MFYVLLTTFYALFAILAWRRLSLAVLLAIVALPAYLVRFSVGPIPMTFLEGLILIVVIIWIIQKYTAWQNESGISLPSGKAGNQESWIGLRAKSLIHNSSFIIPLTLFLLAATMSMFIAPDLRAAAGVWKAYFVEPILFFLVLVDLMKSQITNTKLQINHKLQIPNYKSLRFGIGHFIGNWKLEIGNLTPRQIVTALSLTALFLSLYAIYQRFTGFGIPPPWAKELRVTSIFPYPNALALFLGPLIPLFLGKIFNTLACRQKLLTTYYLLLTTLSLLAIIFAKSTGALVGITAGLSLMTFLKLFQHHPTWRQESRIKNQELRIKKSILHNSSFMIPLVILLALALGITATNKAFRDEILLRDWSGQVRRTQWTETWEMLKDRPILGAGLSGYPAVFKSYHKATYIEIFQYPHNIVLNFWSEIGLLGLIAFIWLIIIFFRQTWHKIKFPISNIQYPIKAPTPKLEIGNWKLEIPVMASMVAILVHGLVDVPYFKNDLAVLFWIIFALGLTNAQKSEMLDSAKS